jgi:hypothetical protein
MARLSATDVNKCFKSRVNVLVCAGGIDMMAAAEDGRGRGQAGYNIIYFQFST